MTSWVITAPSASESTLSIASSYIEDELEKERVGERPIFTFDLSKQPPPFDTDDEEDIE